ncbi:S1/P1 nuclease [Sphingomonas naphthae]|uniref:S1/P1 nuclease n=1 Tax=Sphingomonas naphthae TaxID=1813468 RepID=A0ABY7TKN3_9SPHN|nr:S1/P1 nuclease [Sphingomonas naphthae]WCT73521.1 S1/P1 nuclease [Sphingomonas naphthae]
MRRIPALLLALAALILTASPAAAWWEWGHETVAGIARMNVTPRTRLEIDRLLKQGALVGTPTCPLKTIEDASVWADCIKPLGDRFSYAYNWHYQNVDICKPFAVKPNCPDGNCVSAQIARAQRMLADRKLPTRDRIEALAFLVHFVGDLHQPLHAGDHHDLGGNQAKVNYGAIGGRMNLHSIWDGLLAERAISTPEAGAKGILAEVPVAERATLAGGTIEDWSRESWQMAHDAYAAVMADPCATPDGRVTMDAATIDRLVPRVRLTIAKGGLRLAKLLDEALDGDHPEVAHPAKGFVR